MKRIINTDKAPAPIGPYNQAIAAKGFLFISGQIPIDVWTGNLITSDIVSQTHQVMKNIKAILEQENMKMQDVIKTSIFLKDMNQFSKVNEVYGSYFSGDYPARETVQVTKLPKDTDIEISAIAYNYNYFQHKM